MLTLYVILSRLIVRLSFRMHPPAVSSLSSPAILIVTVRILVHCACCCISLSLRSSASRLQTNLPASPIKCFASSCMCLSRKHWHYNSLWLRRGSDGWPWSIVLWPWETVPNRVTVAKVFSTYMHLFMYVYVLQYKCT